MNFPVRPEARLLLAAGCFGAWLALLFLGHLAGGAIHLLAVAGVALVPWRRDRPDSNVEES